MISQTAEYALRAITCLASNPDSPMTTQQIAKIAHIPAGYLSKVLQGLGRAGMVLSMRGLHGGFVLSKKPSEFTILEIVQAVDPIQRITHCPLNIQSHNKELCPLHRQLDHAIEIVENAFRQTTIVELLTAQDSPAPMCEAEAKE